MRLIIACLWIASAISSVAQPPPTRTITATEAQAFGVMIEADHRTNGSAFFMKSLDLRRLLELACAGQPGSEEFKRGFRDGFLDSSFNRNFATGMATFETYKLLRISMTNARPQLIFRGLGAEGEVNYHILELERSRNDRIRVVDIFIMISGEKMSETLRRLYLINATQADRSLLARLAHGKGDWITHQEDLQQLSRLVRTGEHQAALKLYDRLPESVRLEKSILVLRLLAAANGSEETYLAAIETFEKLFPNDPCLALISVDGFVMKKQPRKAIASLEKLDRFIGGDPYLLALLAGQYLELHDTAKAQALANTAIEREPALTHSYDVLLGIALGKEDFEETARLLTLTEKNLKLSLLETIQADADYKNFVASTAGKKWQADRKATK